MVRTTAGAVKRPRLSIDLEAALRRRLRLAAAMRDVSVRQYVQQALEARLEEDLGGKDETTLLSSRTDPVLAELWDNPRDAGYDDL